MKTMTLALLVSLFSSTAFSKELNYPAKISTNGTGEVQLTIMADGGSRFEAPSECKVQVGQGQEIKYTKTLKLKGHGSLIGQVTLKEGPAEIFIRCDSEASMYFNIITVTTDSSGKNTVGVANQQIFDKKNDQPAYIGASTEFHKDLNIVE